MYGTNQVSSQIKRFFNTTTVRYRHIIQGMFSSVFWLISCMQEILTLNLIALAMEVKAEAKS